MTVPRFLIDSDALAGPVAVLTGHELHHFRARRLRVGSTIVLTDGHGHQRRGIVTRLDRYQAVIRIGDEETIERDSPLQLTLAQALLKRDKLDWVIEKATELGVSEILVFTSERTVQRVPSERRDRWMRVMSSAAQQCQRSTVPRIAGPASFDALLDHAPAALRLLFWEECQPGSLAAVRREQGQATAVLAAVGPEGGFSVTEAERAAAAGFHLVGLTPRILRAETAALAVVTLCQFLWGDLGETR